MPTQVKIDRVGELKDKLDRCTIAVSASYAGIPVNDMTELRRQMRTAGVEFMVIKNTLMGLAADAAQRPQVKEILQGPTAIAFGYNDPVATAKALFDYIRTSRSPMTVQGAVMGDGPALRAAEVNRLATLPSREQLMANLLGQMQAPLQRLLGILNAPVQNLGSLLHQRMQQLEAAGQATQ